jgi:hypothetical protein
MERSAVPSYTGTKRTELGDADEGQSSFGLISMGPNNARIDFAVCIASDGYDDLELCKVYCVLTNVKAVEVGCLRVIDESGEDYLYPADRFMLLDLPEAARKRLLRAVNSTCA